jgi:NAD(P)-dependent dehydrogenase (short-subunit alcohol dehydrogenase family)
MNSTVEGKTVLVTGATNGIGLETARELSRMGAQVTIVSRNAEKCAAVAGAIKTETGNRVKFIAADLSTLAGIRQAAVSFKQFHSQLHILVNNAGGFFFKRIVTPDGYEKTFALNHLNYFLLTTLLLDLLKVSAPTRVVNVASGSHVGARIDFNDLQGKKRYGGFRAYGQSKLANVLFTYELSRRLNYTGVTVNALHPGYVDTGIPLSSGFPGKIAKLSARLFAQKPEEGAQTSIYLAASTEVEGVTGKYFIDCRPVASSPESYDKLVAEKLWQVSLNLTGSVNTLLLFIGLLVL